MASSPIENVVGAPSSVSQRKIVIANGLALFAMFFGAGNIVFPLYLGANTGNNLLFTTLGFLIAGVGVPFLGLIASSLYQGDYHAFFARLGKIPGFLLTSFLMIIIGPLAATPRTETTTFNALLPYLPDFLQNNTILSVLYCSVVFVLAFKETKIVDILGLFLSPVKIVSFTCLVFLGLWISEKPIPTLQTEWEAFRQAIAHGYNTMDLLATFFYCTVAFKAIQLATKQDPSLNPSHLTLKACTLGAVITPLVYLGFMWVAHGHAAALQGLPEEKMISAISYAILGQFGRLFVCISVSFACLATALALSEISSNFLYREIFRQRIPKTFCLTIVCLVTYLMSNLGFQGIMKLTLPLLNIVYPMLIVLCIFNILYKWKGIATVKVPVLVTVLACIALSFY